MKSTTNIEFIITLKVIVAASTITQGDVTLLLQGGAALNITNVRKKPYEWISDEAWLNVMKCRPVPVLS